MKQKISEIQFLSLMVDDLANHINSIHERIKKLKQDSPKDKNTIKMEDKKLKWTTKMN